MRNDHYFRQLNALPLRRGEGSRDWGHVALTMEHPFPTRLVTAFNAKAKQPWYLATNSDDVAQEITRYYARRMWIEEMFRDLKNRKWGLGLDESVLSSPARQDRMVAVLALTYLFLCAYGAAAESAGLDEALKPNTEKSRVMSLARMANYFIQVAALSLSLALLAFPSLPP